MIDAITVESSYDVYYSTDIHLPEDKTRDDIDEVIHKWAYIWIKWKDGTESKFEQDFDMQCIDDGKWPYRLVVTDTDGNNIYERDF